MSTQRKRVGFTIVELIIAVTVIAILASITVVGYRGVQERGRAAAASAALKDASGKLKLYKFDNSEYPDTGQLAAAGIADGNGVTYQYTGSTSTYCLTATSKNVSYKIEQNGTPVAGGCAGHGINGVAAITNLASNPSAETNLTGVSGYYSPPITRDTALASSGSASFLTTTNSTTNPQGMIFTITTSASPSQQYTCSVALAGTPGATVILSGRPATSADGYINEGIGSANVTLGASLVRATTQFTTPATTGILRIQVRVTSAVSGVTIRADAIMCTTGSTVYQFADGNTANWAWTGTQNNSASSGPPL